MDSNKRKIKTMQFLRLFVYLMQVTSVCGIGVYEYGSVYCVNQKCTFKAELDKTATGYATYNDTLMETGWGILDIMSGHGNKGQPQQDKDIMYAAGYLEGRLTHRRINMHYQNMKNYFLDGRTTEVVQKLRSFFNTQDVWMRTQIASHVNDSFWRHVGLVLAQFDGQVAGYKSVAPESEFLDSFAFQVLNGVGDLLDLVKAVDPESIPDWKKMSRDEATLYVQRHGFCSALIKVTGDFENLFLSHSSWFVYQATMRIYKHYNFNVNDPETRAKRMSFSSYPGFLESLDDFYLLGSKMALLQTTNNVFNTSLYQFVVPQSLLAWQRVRVANMMADSGKEWAVQFTKFNSGTYNNQYMVLDLKQIVLNQSIRDGALWVVEQIPTRVSAADVTPILRTGYWPSYNVPFFEDIYNMSGYPEFVAQHGTDGSYQLAPRAKIFRRDEGKVVDMKTMKAIMRYNEYETDPYSEKNSCNTICCRGDLLTKGARADGCYDTKVSDYKMALNFEADIINGPTRGTSLKPFEWSSKYNVSHVGLPPKYNFDFLSTSPRWNMPNL